MNINLSTVVNIIPDLVFSQVQGFISGHLVRHFVFPGVNPLAASIAFVVKDLIYDLSFAVFKLFEIKINMRNLCIVVPAASLGCLYAWKLVNSVSRNNLIYINLAISISAIAISIIKVGLIIVKTNKLNEAAEQS